MTLLHYVIYYLYYGINNGIGDIIAKVLKFNHSSKKKSKKLELTL